MKQPQRPLQIQSQLPKLAGTVDADVSNLNQVQAAFADAVRLMGGVDVLINNAGISIRHNFLDITPEEWDKTIAVNLTGVFYAAQTAARHMWERGSGVILQTASTNGLMGYPFYADYNATKAGVIELTKSMALELAPKVRVCAVAPGYVLTPMQRAEYTDEMLDAVNRKIPLGRHAKPEEIAALFAFLASDDAAFMTGQSESLPIRMPTSGEFALLMDVLKDFPVLLRQETSNAPPPMQRLHAIPLRIQFVPSHDIRGNFPAP